MRLVLFDCDGTLVDSGRLIHEVMRRTFDRFGLEEPHYDRTRSVIGITLDLAIAKVMGQDHVDDRVEAMTAYYKAIYSDVRKEPGFQEPMFDGIDEMIARLATTDDLILGAVTGKSRRGLDLIVDAHGLRDIFFVSRTADDCPSKPHPAMVTECCRQAGIEPARTIVIGDAIYDMQMARAAGATGIGVSWGYGDVDDLYAAGAVTVLDHPHAITSHLFGESHA